MVRGRSGRLLASRNSRDEETGEGSTVAAVRVWEQVSTARLSWSEMTSFMLLPDDQLHLDLGSGNVDCLRRTLP